MKGILGFIFVATAGCGSAPTSGSSVPPDRFVLTATRLEPDGTGLHRIQVRLEAGDRRLFSSVVSAFAGQWTASFRLHARRGFAPARGKNGEPPLREIRTMPYTLSGFVCCSITPDGRIASKLRVSAIREGRIVWSFEKDLVGASGEAQVFSAPR